MTRSFLPIRSRRTEPRSLGPSVVLPTMDRVKVADLLLVRFEANLMLYGGQSGNQVGQAGFVVPPARQ
jgi:hypothetical protein